MLHTAAIERCSRALTTNSANIAPAVLCEASVQLLRDLQRHTSNINITRASAGSLNNRLECQSDIAALQLSPIEACSIGLTAWADAQWARCIALSKSEKCASVFLDVLLLYQRQAIASRPHHMATLATRHVDASRPRCSTMNVANNASTSPVVWARESVLLGDHAPVDGKNITTIRGSLYSCTYLLGLLRDPARWNAWQGVDVYRRVTLISPQWSGPRTAVDVAGGLDYGSANKGVLGPKFRLRLSPYVLSRDWSDRELDALSTLLEDDA
jgi:hypothetical protein